MASLMAPPVPNASFSWEYSIEIFHLLPSAKYCRINSPRYPVDNTKRLTPCRFKFTTRCSRKGMLPTGAMGLGRSLRTDFKRVPKPPARMIVVRESRVGHFTFTLCRESKSITLNISLMESENIGILRSGAFKIKNWIYVLGTLNFSVL